MQAMPAAFRAILEQGLSYPESSAGRLMQRDVVAVPGFWTVGETIDFLRRSRGLPDDFYDLFVVDPAHRPAGTVPTSISSAHSTCPKPHGISSDSSRYTFGSTEAM